MVKKLSDNAGNILRCGFNPCVGKTPWRRKWQPTPVFLPGESHGEDPGRLQSMGHKTVEHDLVTKQQQQQMC